MRHMDPLFSALKLLLMCPFVLIIDYCTDWIKKPIIVTGMIVIGAAFRTV